MKKTLLVALLVVPALLFAQEPVKEIKTNLTQAVEFNPELHKAIDSEKAPEGTGRTNLKYKTINYSFVNIGKTFYDLQTNSSSGRRIMLHSNGNVSATWTTHPVTSPTFPDRGSGYNYNDGSSWLGVINSRVEASTRTGWPSIMLLGNGNEALIAHESNTGGFVMSTNTGSGNTTWTSSAAILDDTSDPNSNRVPIWNRSAAGGDYIHLISNYWFSTAANVPLVTRAGVTSPTTYSRSSDNGATWDTAHMLLPGYDSTLYASGGGDNYAIDVKDSVVAIVIGGLGDPVSLWKSTDNGMSFTYTDVDKMPFKGATAAAQLFLSGDTLDANDGSVDVMLDNNNNAHVFYGFTRITADITSTGDTGIFFLPGNASLRHWKEGDTAVRVAGATIDTDLDNALTITSETISALDVNDNVPSGLLSATRMGTQGIVSQPSAATDASGNLFVVYSAAIENDLHFLNSNFRDVLVSYSTDGGDTWLGPQNITQTRGAESTFPCVAKTADNFLHLIWQEDLTSGTNLQNHSAAAGTHPNDENDIMYAAIPTADIIGNVIGQHTLGEKKIDRDAKVLVVNQNQPNPFNGTSDVIVYLQSGSETSLTITDILGNTISADNLGVLGAGNHRITLDATGFASGVYFYTIATKDHSITKKMQVK